MVNDKLLSGLLQDKRKRALSRSMKEANNAITTYPGSAHGRNSVDGRGSLSLGDGYPRTAETGFVTPTVENRLHSPPHIVVSRSYILPTAYAAPSYYSEPLTSFRATIPPRAMSQARFFDQLRRRTGEPTAHEPRRDHLSQEGCLDGDGWSSGPSIAGYGTTYIPSSYIANYETSYVPSSYVLPTYYATSYRARTYTPTVHEYPVVWETSVGGLTVRSDCERGCRRHRLSSSPPSSALLRPSGEHQQQRRARSSREKTRPFLRMWMHRRRGDAAALGDRTRPVPNPPVLEQFASITRDQSRSRFQESRQPPFQKSARPTRRSCQQLRNRRSTTASPPAPTRKRQLRTRQPATRPKLPLPAVRLRRTIPSGAYPSATRTGRCIPCGTCGPNGGMC